MNAVIKEWIGKAEGDLTTSGKEFAVLESPNYDDICFST